MRERQLLGGGWIDRLLDGAFVVLAVLAQVEIWVQPEAEHQPLLVVLTLVWTLAPLARRRLPFAAPVTSLVALGAMTFVADEYVASIATSVVGLALVTGVLAAYNEPRVAAAGLALAWGVVGLVVAQDPQERFVGSLVAGLVASACWLVGLGWYRRSAYAAALRERAERAERERETSARVAVAEERARIARELHDVVAHSVSVMVLQAGAVRRLLRDDQAREREALGTVERTGREALAEMRRLLGVLRADDEQAELAPQPGLSELAALVARTEAAGLPVALRGRGGAARGAAARCGSVRLPHRAGSPDEHAQARRPRSGSGRDPLPPRRCRARDQPTTAAGHPPPTVTGMASWACANARRSTAAS